MNNKVMIHPTPIPIETCLSIEDSRRDDKLFNRYWFKYPAEWMTACNNEKIIGVRSAHILKSYKKLTFDVCLLKYSEAEFKAACLRAKADGKLDIDEKTFDFSLRYIAGTVKAARIIEIAHSYMNKDNINEATIPIFMDLKYDNNIRVVFAEYDRKYVKVIPVFNKGIKSTQPKFKETDDVTVSLPDVLWFDDIIREKGVDELRFILTSHNINNSDDPTQRFYTDCSIRNMNEDFKHVFNIVSVEDYDDESYDTKRINVYENITRFNRYHRFYNLWDRSSCKLYSSLASQANKNYLCNTDVHFNPIKYFIVKSTDAEFYIDFYSSKHPKMPINLPTGDDFFIELQLTQNKKLLYI